ncbi:hypothetical protein GGR57DRAFT_513805, partial [Xylariaceae sp. FL1272]
NPILSTHSSTRITQYLKAYHAVDGFQKSHKKELDVFQWQYKEYSKLDLSRLGHDELERIVRDLFMMINSLFFFGLLTRHIPTDPLRLHTDLNPYRPGASLLEKCNRYLHRSRRLEPLIFLSVKPQDKHYLGHYEYEYRRIHICTHDQQWNPRSLKSIFMTVCRQMTQAYLDLFSDRTGKDYMKLVRPYGNQGDLYWDIVEFIPTKLFEYTKLEDFRCLIEQIPNHKALAQETGESEQLTRKESTARSHDNSKGKVGDQNAAVAEAEVPIPGQNEAKCDCTCHNGKEAATIASSDKLGPKFEKID